MVRAKYLFAAVLAAVAGLSFSSCTPKEDVQPDSKVGFASTEASFSAEGKATLNLTVSPIPTGKVSVNIAAGSEAQEGKTAVSATALTFGNSVSIEAGESRATIEVSVNLDEAENGQQAVIVISSASGAKVDSDKATAYITVVKSDTPDDSSDPDDLSGADVWSIIGDFNSWSEDVDLTMTSESPEIWEIEGIVLSGGVKFRGNHSWDKYDLGTSKDAKVVSGEELDLVFQGENIIPDEGTYDVVLYPVDKKAVFTLVEEPVIDPSEGTLDWTVAFNGNLWVEGLYSYGQVAVFEVSGTDFRYYYPVIINLEDDDSIIEALQNDPQALLAQIDEEVSEMIEQEMTAWNETLEEALPYVLYNEENDGSEIYYYGLPAGEYEFAVFTVDEEGKVDGDYKAFSFTVDEDPLEVYPFVDQANLNSNWTVAYEDWEYEGASFWVTGKAPGAAYVFCEWFTDDEIEKWYEGSITVLQNLYGMDVADAVFEGTELDEYLYPVESDGSFEALMYTYDEEGPYPVYIMGFDSEGKVLADYGLNIIETPEIAPIEWKERTDWSANYDEQNPDGITVSVCDAEYFVVEIYPEGYLEETDTIEDIADDATFWTQAYGVQWCIESGLAFDSVPAVYLFEDAYYYQGVPNGCEIYIFGIDANGKPTGEWHKEILTGAPELEMELVEDWSVAIDGTPYYVEYEGDDYLVVDVVVNAPGIDYYYVEENTQDDLDEYYDGTVLGLALDYQSLYRRLMAYGCTMDDFFEYEMAFNEENPATSIDLYNPGTESTIYILEYDENGFATGRYGATTLTLPEEPDEVRSVVPAKAAKLKVNVLPGLHARTVSGKAAAKSATSKTIQKGGKAGAKPAFSANVQPKSHPVNVDASRLSKGGKAKAKAGVKAVSRINKHDLKAGRR